MKVKNLSIYSTDEDRLNRLEADYRFIGFDTDRKVGTLVVLAYPKDSAKKRREAEKAALRREEEEED